MNLKLLFKKIGVKKGDKILLTTNLIQILSKFKKKEINFSPNTLINELIKTLGVKGTLLIPTYNWDFCKGKIFDFKKTRSQVGALGNMALKRKDFSRSFNPIYSLAVTGNDKNKICKIKHVDCFSLNSPFGYLLKNRGKNLFIDVKKRYAGETNLTGFIFHHVVEQDVGVKDRYIKEFKGHYIDKKRNKKKIKIKFYVKNLKFKYKIYISKKINKYLEKKGILKGAKFRGIKFDLMKLNNTYKILKKDLKASKKFFKKHP